MSEHDRPATVSPDERSADATGAGRWNRPPVSPPRSSRSPPPRPRASRPISTAATTRPLDPPIWSAAAEGIDVVASPRPAGDSDDAAQAAPVGRRSGLLRPRNLVLVTVAVLAIVVAAIFGPAAWDLWSAKNAKLSTPDHVAGLVLDDSQGAHDTIDYLRTAVETGVSLQKTTEAVYEDQAGKSRSGPFIGGTGVLVSPEQALSKTFGLITDDAGGVDGVHEVPPGARGGIMKCGSTKTDGGAMAVCGWADHWNARDRDVPQSTGRPVS